MIERQPRRGLWLTLLEHIVDTIQFLIRPKLTNKLRKINNVSNLNRKSKSNNTRSSSFIHHVRLRSLSMRALHKIDH
jgi:hypothetical protein